MGPSGPFLIMLITIYLLLFILAVMAITYPKEFPSLIRNPELLLRAIGQESRRRWLMLKIGSQLWFERKQMAFSLWRARDTIAAERAKHKQQEEPND